MIKFSARPMKLQLNDAYSLFPKLTWCIQKKICDKKNELKADNCDPMRQVNFRNDSAEPYTPIIRRLERRRERIGWCLRQGFVRPNGRQHLTLMILMPMGSRNSSGSSFWDLFMLATARAVAAMFRYLQKKCLRSWGVTPFRFTNFCVSVYVFFLIASPLFPFA